MGCDIHTYVEVKEGGRWVGNDEEVFEVPDIARWDYRKDYYPTKHSVHPDLGRNYSLFGWLAGVRNYSAVVPLSAPRGVPDDLSGTVSDEAFRWEGDGHTHSYFTAAELLAVDYEQTVEDRRHTVQEASGIFNGGATCAPGKGVKEKLGDFIGRDFITVVKKMATLHHDPKCVRLVFWFDN